jgi:hypothetical protein
MMSENKLNQGLTPTSTTNPTPTLTTDLNKIQQQTYCNWCRNSMTMSEPITEANFVDVGKKWHDSDTENAKALYCSDCLKDPARVRQPKSVIDRVTLAEINVSDLP